MMRGNINLTKNLLSSGEFYSEDVVVAALPYDHPASFLDLSSCGRSFFQRGAVISILSGSWVLQHQTEGRGEVESEGETFHLAPGDILAVPPNVKYEYRVSRPAGMRKEFLIFTPGALIEFLLGNEIRKNGILVRGAGDSAAACFERIRVLMENLTYSSLEDLSAELYRLCFKIRSMIAGHAPYGNFESKLRAAANDLSGPTSLENLSKKFGLGKYSLIRAFRRETGKPPVAFMISMRLKQAERLLALSGMSVAEIASACGYSSPSFFSYEFKKHFGITPRESRARARRTGSLPMPLAAHQTL